MNPNSPPAPPHLIRIRLRYASLDTFVEKFAPNVTRGGVFLASRNMQPVGALIAFEIQLAGGEVMLAGRGRVTWVKEYNVAEPNRPFGMGVQFVSIDPASKPILARILRIRDASGQGRRITTGPLVPLMASSSGPNGSGAVRHSNGKPAVAAVDTSVDLAAEYGLDDQTVRRLVERTWMTGARTSDDLSDLLKTEPEEPVTLAQALAELPRLLDPQYSRRRRTSSGFRALDARGVSNDVVPSSTNGTTQTHLGPMQIGEGVGDSLDENATTDLTDAADPAEITDLTGHGEGPAARGSPPNGTGRRRRR